MPAIRLIVPPVVVAVVAVGLVLGVTGVPFADYARSTEPISFFLGPAVVSLALPTHQRRREIIAILPGILLCASLAVGTIFGVVRWRHVDGRVAPALVVLNSTSPMAFRVTDALGGLGSLAAALDIVVGTMGAVAGPRLLRLLRVTDHCAQGLALGVSSHAIGTSRAFEMRPGAGAYAAIGMARLSVPYWFRSWPRW